MKKIFPFIAILLLPITAAAIAWNDPHCMMVESGGPVNWATTGTGRMLMIIIFVILMTTAFILRKKRHVLYL